MLTHGHIRVVLLVLSVLTHASTAQNTNDPSILPTYRSIVSEVRLTFFATDENNQRVANLTKSDFAVVDSELVVRNFRSFTPADETSLDVIALVDLSESVAPRLRVAMNDVLQLVAREQSIPDDDIAVLSFGGTFGGAPEGALGGMRPAVLCSSSCRAADSMNRLQAAKSSGTTPLFDALIFGADFIAHHRRAGVRPVLILYSDGNDTFSMHSAREALDAVLDAGALIYAVDLGTSENRSSNQTAGSMFLRRVANASGGRYFPLRSSSNDGAATVLKAALEDLRASYVVVYDLPSHQPGFHSLCLMPTHNLNLTFHSRTGYYYEPSVR